MTSPYDDTNEHQSEDYLPPRMLNTRDIEGAFPSRFRHRSKK